MVAEENYLLPMSTDYHQLLGRQILNTAHLGG
jgi:hypothetical protein